MNLKNFVIDAKWLDRCRSVKTELDNALLGLECLEALEYVQPPFPPAILKQFEDDKSSMEWRNKAPADREMIQKKIFSKPEVLEYLEKRDAISCENQGNAHWLEIYIKIFLDNDRDAEAKKCWEVYKKYPEEIYYGGVRLWQKKKRFRE